VGKERDERIARARVPVHAVRDCPDASNWGNWDPGTDTGQTEHPSLAAAGEAHLAPIAQHICSHWWVSILLSQRSRTKPLMLTLRALRVHLRGRPCRYL